MSEDNKKVTKDIACCKFPDILGGVVFITIGLILFLNNFNVIPWSIWNYLSYFWPVIFVFIGLDLISGNSWLAKLITTVIGLLIIIFIVFYSLTSVDPRSRNFIYKNFPLLQKVFQAIPKGYSKNTNLYLDNGQRMNIRNYGGFYTD